MDFWSITALVTLLVMSPGPAFAIIVDNSLQYGRFPGVSTAFGIMLGDLFHIVINLAGLSLIIIQFPKVMVVLQIAGALYFFYIGVQLIIKAHKGGPVDASIVVTTQKKSPTKKQRDTASSSFIKDGLFVGMMNPKACLFYLNFFSVMLPLTLSTTHRALLGAWILVIVLVWFSFVALTLGHNKLRNIFLSYQPLIKRICGMALIYFGAILLWEKMGELPYFDFFQAHFQ